MRGFSRLSKTFPNTNISAGVTDGWSLREGSFELGLFASKFAEGESALCSSSVVAFTPSGLPVFDETFSVECSVLTRDNVTLNIHGVLAEDAGVSQVDNHEVVVSFPCEGTPYTPFVSIVTGDNMPSRHPGVHLYEVVVSNGEVFSAESENIFPTGFYVYPGNHFQLGIQKTPSSITVKGYTQEIDGTLLNTGFLIGATIRPSAHPQFFRGNLYNFNILNH